MFPDSMSRCRVLGLVLVSLFAASCQQPANRQARLNAPKPPSAKVEDKYVSYFKLRAQREIEKERGIFYPRLVRGNKNEKTIALTFDDGPHPGVTEKLLKILRDAKVQATFFVIGKMVDKNPDLIKREFADGHEIANHTYDHFRLPTLKESDIEKQLTRCGAAIKAAIGYTPKLYRPPGGEYNDDAIEATKKLGYTMVLWTDDPGDYLNPGKQKILDFVESRISNGGIILLHDGIVQTLEILPRLISDLRAKGYKFVTCSQLGRERGVIKNGGPFVKAHFAKVGSSSVDKTD